MNEESMRGTRRRALLTAEGLRAGTWESVEALALLAADAPEPVERASLRQQALRVATSLKPGTWDSVGALACLARLDGQLAGEHEAASA